MIHRRHFKIPPEKQQRNQHALAKKIQLYLIFHGENRNGTVDIYNRCGERDKKIHSRSFVFYRAVGVFIEYHAGAELDKRSKHELHKRRQIPQQRHRQKHRGDKRAKNIKAQFKLSFFLGVQKLRTRGALKIGFFIVFLGHIIHTYTLRAAFCRPRFLFIRSRPLF